MSKLNKKAFIAANKDRILRLPAVINRCSISRSTIFRLEKQGDFPERVQIGPRAVGWLESSIDKWMESRVAG